MNFSNMTMEEMLCVFPMAKDFFKQINIDCSTRENRYLIDVIKEHGLNIEEVLESFKSLGSNSMEENIFLQLDINRLCEYIERVHHTYLKGLVDKINAGLISIVEEYATSHPELIHIEQLLDILFNEIKTHIEYEENELFALIKKGEKKLKDKIDALCIQFDRVEKVLNELRDIAFYYFLPCDVDEDFKNFYQTIQELEENLFSHIHLEKNIFFKRIVI